LTPIKWRFFHQSADAVGGVELSAPACAQQPRESARKAAIRAADGGIHLSLGKIFAAGAEPK